MNNDLIAYKEKAKKQDFVFVLYSTKYPYLPIDFAYSLYEIAFKYSQKYDTILKNYERKTANNLGFNVEKVYLN